ncbi:flagellar hook capping FlgD N-terminal domain-containing protein [Amnibacterium endophyticum]|uniref:Flagellar hook capping FlgD N-terminal domain-containing protein n=1 Tax=Amnibacterium endophyticum TaxID=2109337 RepID=A0ABW4LD60_9MICO
MTNTIAPAAPQGTSLQVGASTRPTSQQYNSELFLKLLTTQLANQDPSSPMDSTQMIAQTSQLASMEQLTKLTQTTSDTYSLQQRTSAANVIGEQVTWTGADGATQSGKVTSVTFDSTNGPQLKVGDQTVALSAVTTISAA